MSRRIGDRLFSLPEFAAARTLMFFASFRSEVETLPMIRRALAAGKKGVLPKVAGGHLDLYGISDPGRDLSPGAWGIPEPRTAVPAEVGSVDLMVVPGAAFDEAGNRLGYGAGFYDSLLPGFAGATVALAFELQIVPSVPAEPHDVPVRKIVTEERIIEAKQRTTEVTETTE